jgi:hypothetical protein
MAAYLALSGLVITQVWRFMPVSPLADGTSGTQPPGSDVLFGVLGLSVAAVGLGLAALSWTAARRLRQQRSIGFCQVVAAISCMGFPLGTVLGVLTFVVLAKPSVRRMFEQAQAARLP